jgi:hypothetical protein
MAGTQSKYPFDFDKEKVPLEIINDKQWVCWHTDPDNRLYKVPINPETNQPAKSNDPNTWSTLHNTILCAKQYGYGIGYMFSDNGIIGIDIDKCVENGQINLRGREILDLFTSYAEYSPSGNGIHILTKGIFPGDTGHKNSKEQIEIYTKGRYFTFTGNRINNYGIRNNQSSINALFSVKFHKEVIPVNDLPPAKSMTAMDIIERIKHSKQADKFNRLYAGDISDYPSASEADAAMCSILAFYTRDAATIYNIISGSGLMRDKWKRSDYRDRTIGSASTIVTEVYDPQQQNIQSTLKDDILKWIELQHTGEFRNIDIVGDLNITRNIQGHLSRILKKLEHKKIIEMSNGKVGYWRIIEKGFSEMNFKNIEENKMPIILPFNIHKVVNIMEKNIIIIAGAPDAGKTAFLLNVIKDNMNQFNVRYYNSEMAAAELNLRLSKFDDMEIDQWDFKAFELSKNFQDIVSSVEFDNTDKYGTIHIIDYLEVYDKHYIVGELIDKIYRKMRTNDITIIAVQKRPGDDLGRGGITTIEKARLALAMDRGNIRLTKAKNWATSVNPNGKSVEFKLINGCKFIVEGKDFDQQISELKHF